MIKKNTLPVVMYHKTIFLDTAYSAMHFYFITKLM